MRALGSNLFDLKNYRVNCNYIPSVHSDKGGFCWPWKRRNNFNTQGGKMKKIKFISACIVGGIGVLIVLVLNRFEWGRRLNGWALKIWGGHTFNTPSISVSVVNSDRMTKLARMSCTGSGRCCRRLIEYEAYVSKSGNWQSSCLVSFFGQKTPNTTQGLWGNVVPMKKCVSRSGPHIWSKYFFFTLSAALSSFPSRCLYFRKRTPNSQSSIIPRWGLMSSWHSYM